MSPQQDACDLLLKTGRVPTSINSQPAQLTQSVTKHINYSIASLSDLLQERMSFIIDIGGYNSEPYGSISFRQSPQVRQVAPSTTETIHVYTVPRQYALRIKSVKIFHYSAQAKQDLFISLWIGAIQIFTTSMVEPIGTASSSPVGITKDTRLIATVGMPYSSIAKTDGIGYPDNYTFALESVFGIAHENDIVSWRVQNQSDLYTHPIKLELYGWAFQSSGRTEEETLRGMMS
jgi:hypothetical protein